MSNHGDLWISSVLPSRARDVGFLRKTHRAGEQRIYLRGAGGEEVNEENTLCATERWTGTDRRKRGKGHAKSGELIKQKTRKPAGVDGVHGSSGIHVPTREAGDRPLGLATELASGFRHCDISGHQDHRCPPRREKTNRVENWKELCSLFI